MSVHELLAEQLRKRLFKNSKERKSMRDLKKIFGQQILLKWSQYLQKIKMLNI